MPRRLRFFVSGIPYHVTQRGNNKNKIFFRSEDYSLFLSILRDAQQKHPCSIYGYCLMPNHFHLLIEPKENENISLLMKLAGTRYVYYVNKKYSRSGTLWEGRFKCSLIDREPYFLACLRYIEMNPLRAGITNSLNTYPWSSYHFRAFGEKDHLLTLDQWYNGLGESMQERQCRYRSLFAASDIKDDWDRIREMTNKCGIFGSNAFKEYVQSIIGREIVLRRPGRPKTREIGSDPVFAKK